MSAPKSTEKVRRSRGDYAPATEPSALTAGSKLCAWSALDRNASGGSAGRGGNPQNWRIPMRLMTSDRKLLHLALLTAASLAVTGASLAQCPQDPSRVTISLPPPSAI